PQLFEEQVERAPGAVALSMGGEQLSYAELDARANRLAHHLRAQDVGPEVRVGICLERSPELVVGLLGILKAGGAYVPRDPSYPRERLEWMLEDSGAELLLTSESLAGRLPAAGRTVLMDRDLPATGPTAHPVPLAGAGNLAYVIYTSGSTGRPKGVGISQGSAQALIGWGRSSYGAGELDGVLWSTSVCFDLSIFEL